MGIELIFFGIVAVFVFTGVARGYRRELGVTIVLMLTLSLLQLADGVFKHQTNSVLSWAISSNAIYRDAMRGLVYCAVLLLVVFVSYQSNILTFPGQDDFLVLNAGAGLLNGYLLAGSLWYYLAQSGWPYMEVPAFFNNPLYWSAWRLLPPHLLIWPIMAVFGGAILALRAWEKSRA